VDAVTPPSAAFVAFEAYVRALRTRILDALREVEPAPAEETHWARSAGGGGLITTLRGTTLEKGALLTSSVHGPSNPLTGQPFQAAGLSLILHPSNPNAPAVHMNLRRFEERSDAWYGAVLDLNPMGIRHPEDVEHFHETLRRTLGHDYERGQQEADAYFFVPHRGRPRGAGGVFYDRIREDDAGLVPTVGDAFLDAYLPLLRRRHAQPFVVADRERQLKDRGTYVEFNLLHDRGTRFGFQSGGNPDAILASLPPLASW
jgi:coproporphyrinogen III oxidase